MVGQDQQEVKSSAKSISKKVVELTKKNQRNKIASKLVNKEKQSKTEAKCIKFPR